MARLIRSAKSGRDWTNAELLAYNISITPTSPADFSLPVQTHPHLSEATADYLGYLDLATHVTQESAIVDFATATLKLLGFNERHATVATRYDIPLTICGETRAAQIDVCLFYRPATILLVLVEDKALFHKANAEAHVVAAAIAAFQFNNTKRAARGQPVLGVMNIPCVTMQLSDAVITQYPLAPSPTRVLRCVTVGAHQRRVSDGMADPEFQESCKELLATVPSLAESPRGGL
ncbi:hypothetical protein FA13DRAFT_1767336 [Coprinellus micaceus]|uniref:Type I restriction enzyme R protein N-terminal domain-containing protein n=1 Tax=Coprinellus micaceus TaxID=71717 RepID=A0A4Y7SBY0_COPMI|nr:hypothetical protein FA13DRAFT_1767336 [Coprinellus micaceus]